MKTPRFATGRARVRMRPLDTSDWPDPPMVPSWALRRCESAETIEEVRTIVATVLSPREHRMVNPRAEH